MTPLDEDDTSLQLPQYIASTRPSRRVMWSVGLIQLASWLSHVRRLEAHKKMHNNRLPSSGMNIYIFRGLLG